MPFCHVTKTIEAIHEAVEQVINEFLESRRYTGVSCDQNGGKIGNLNRILAKMPFNFFLII